MHLRRGTTLVFLAAALAAAAPAMAADPPPTDAAAPPTPAAAPPAPAAESPAAAPTPPSAPTPPATRPLVAIVVTQSLKDARWNREWGEIFTGGKEVNDLAHAISSQTQTMLAAMGYDAKIVGPDERVDGARFYITPNIKQNQETTGVWAFSRVTDTIVLEWRVTDASGGTALVDTVTGVGESAIGNVFTAQSEAKMRFHRLMDDLFAKSQTLLTPALPHP